MKTLVKNEHLLNLPVDKLAILHTRAELHRRYSSLTFKVVKCTTEKLTVQVVQEKSHSENYFDTKRLVEIVRETFSDLGPWTTIHANPIPCRPAPTEIVTAEWIREKMQKSGLKVKPLANALGIDPTSLSAYKNGVRPLSGVVKAMFYYYFKVTDAQFFAANPSIAPYKTSLEIIGRFFCKGQRAEVIKRIEPFPLHRTTRSWWEIVSPFDEKHVISEGASMEQAVETAFDEMRKQLENAGY